MPLNPLSFQSPPSGAQLLHPMGSLPEYCTSHLQQADPRLHPSCRILPGEALTQVKRVEAPVSTVLFIPLPHRGRSALALEEGLAIQHLDSPLPGKALRHGLDPKPSMASSGGG